MKKPKDDKILKVFYPFAFFRLDSLAEYLTKMRREGYMIEDINSYNILTFKKVKPRDDLRYIVLGEYFGYRQKFWDVGFMQKRINQFDRIMHKQFTSMANRVYFFHIYMSSELTDEDFDALKDYRRKRIKKVNAVRAFEHIFIFCFIVALIYLFPVWIKTL